MKDHSPTGKGYGIVLGVEHLHVIQLAVLLDEGGARLHHLLLIEGHLYASRAPHAATQREGILTHLREVRLDRERHERQDVLHLLLVLYASAGARTLTLRGAHLLLHHGDDVRGQRLRRGVVVLLQNAQGELLPGVVLASAVATVHTP